MCFNEKEAAGTKNIPIEFIKISSECISVVLSNIFNKCIQAGVFPSKLKVAKITPMHKGGYTFKATNYRPISVLPPFSKIFEKIIYKRLNKYFTRHNIPAKEQFGFREKHSTNHVLSDVTNKLQNYCDHKHFTFLILLDLSKAFHTIDHQIVLNKLQKYGIRGNFLQLLNDYLTNRKPIDYINNTYSRQQDVSSGVPQG